MKHSRMVFMHLNLFFWIFFKHSRRHYERKKEEDTPWTQDVNWTSYLHSIYVLCTGGKHFQYLIRDRFILVFLFDILIVFLSHSLHEDCSSEEIFGSFFPVFGMNTEIYKVNLRIQFKYIRIRTRKILVFGHSIPSG